MGTPDGTALMTQHSGQNDTSSVDRECIVPLDLLLESESFQIHVDVRAVCCPEFCATVELDPNVPVDALLPQLERTTPDSLFWCWMRSDQRPALGKSIVEGRGTEGLMPEDFAKAVGVPVEKAQMWGKDTAALEWVSAIEFGGQPLDPSATLSDHGVC